MKISSSQKLENRKKIIRSTVDMMLDSDLKSTTMRAIARKCGIGDATIYNYFPTKESILYAYYEESMNTCIEKLRSIENFNEYSLQEQLQTFFETQFELFLPDREFIQKTFRQIFFSFSQDYKRLMPVKKQFFNCIEDMLSAAVEVGEIPDQVFEDLMYHFFWDYNIGIVLYWNNDTSDGFTDTTVFNDKSIDLIVSVIKSNIVNKAFDIATFLFRNHILDKMQDIQKPFKAAQFLKREFTGGRDAGKTTEK